MAIPMRPVRSSGPALRDGTIEVELPEGFGEGGGKERLAWLRGKAGCMVNRPGARFLQGKEADIRRHVQNDRFQGGESSGR